MVRNRQFLRDGKASHSPCIWMSAKPIHGVAFLSCWFTLKGVCCCEEIWSKRTRVFEDDVFIENTRLVGGSKTQDLNLRTDLVLNMSRGPSGQWFPETEYWASTIFVGTSGIPPKIIYWSVKSYMCMLTESVNKSFLLTLSSCLVFWLWWQRVALMKESLSGFFFWMWFAAIWREAMNWGRKGICRTEYRLLLYWLSGMVSDVIWCLSLIFRIRFSVYASPQV